MKIARPVALIDSVVEARPSTKPLEASSFGVPPFVRAAIARVAPVAPTVAAWALDRLWFTPPRPRISGKAQGILDRHPRLSLTVGGRRLAAWTAGAGPTIVLMHGWGGYGAQLSAFVAPLVQAGFRVVVFDGLGHGASDRSPLGIRQASFLDFANAIERLAATTGPIFGIVAHSGGAVATLLALRAGVAVDRVVLVAPMARPHLYAAQFARFLGIDKTVFDRWIVRSERRVGFRFADLDLVRAPNDVALPPTCVVHDREDPEVPFTEGQAIAGAWPGASIHETTKLGHRLLLRDPDVVQRVIEFMSAPRRVTKLTHQPSNVP